MLKPLLALKVSNSWFDPTKGDRDKILNDYLIAWGAAQAVNEVLKLEAIMKDRAEYLIKKEKGEVVDNFKIGA